MVSAPNVYFAKNLETGLTILGLFDKDHSRRTLSEISRLAGINKTSTYRLVNTLVLLGDLSKNARSKALRLWPKALLFGHTIHCRLLSRAPELRYFDLILAARGQYCPIIFSADSGRCYCREYINRK